MKNSLTKQLYIGLLAFALFFAGCKSNSLKSRLIGKWDYQTITVNGQTFKGRQLGSPVMEFKSNGVVVTITGNLKSEEHWDVNDDSTIVFTGEPKPHYMKVILFSQEHLVLESQNEVKTTITLAPSKGDNTSFKNNEEEEEKRGKK